MTGSPNSRARQARWWSPASRPAASWIVVGRLRLRGYVVLQGQSVDAINFELAAPDPAPAAVAVEAAALALGWEVHRDDSHADEDDEP